MKMMRVICLGLVLAGALTLGQARADAVLDARQLVAHGDWAVATDLLERGMREGDGKAAAQLGLHYSLGIGTNQDLVKAAEVWRQAALQGSPECAYWLAVAYYNGTGVELNPDRAAQLFTAAAEAGMVKAQRQLGWLYLTGRGVKADRVRALFWTIVAETHSEAGFERDEIRRARQYIARNLTSAQTAKIRADVAAWKPGAFSIPAFLAS